MAPPPPPPASLIELPPALPCAGLVGGVFPAPPAPVQSPAEAPPPPLAPAAPANGAAGGAVPGPLFDPPPPPPADVIVEKVETDPEDPTT